MVPPKSVSYGDFLHNLVYRITSSALPLGRRRPTPLESPTVTVTRYSKAYLETRYSKTMYEQAPLDSSLKRLDLADTMSGQPKIIGEVKTRLGDARRVPTQLQTYSNIYPSTSVEWFVFLPSNLVSEIERRHEGILEVLWTLRLHHSVITVCRVNVDTGKIDILVEARLGYHGESSNEDV